MWLPSPESSCSSKDRACSYSGFGLKASARNEQYCLPSSVPSEGAGLATPRTRKNLTRRNHTIRTNHSLSSGTATVGWTSPKDSPTAPHGGHAGTLLRLLEHRRKVKIENLRKVSTSLLAKLQGLQPGLGQEWQPPRMADIEFGRRINWRHFFLRWYLFDCADWSWLSCKKTPTPRVWSFRFTDSCLGCHFEVWAF